MGVHMSKMLIKEVLKKIWLRKNWECVSYTMHDAMEMCHLYYLYYASQVNSKIDS